MEVLGIQDTGCTLGACAYAFIISFPPLDKMYFMFNIMQSPDLSFEAIMRYGTAPDSAVNGGIRKYVIWINLFEGSQQD
jgi:hypothetical protein